MKLPVNIKKKQSSMPVYAATSIIMLCIALFCLFTPFIAPFSTAMSKSMLNIYMAIGGVTTMFFAFFTAYTVYNIISPPIGITLSEEGVYEYTVAGAGAGFIPKEAIVSLKTYGKDKKQYLGINVASDYLDELGETPAAKREIFDNVDAGAPAVIIRQADIYVTVNKLMKLLIQVYGAERTAPPAKPAEIKPKEETVTEAPKQKETNTVKQTVIQPEKEEVKPHTAVNVKAEKPENKTVSPSPNVIKTVDELLAQLNISVKPKGDGEQ